VRINDGGGMRQDDPLGKDGDGVGDRWFGAHKQGLRHAEDVPLGKIEEGGVRSSTAIKKQRRGCKRGIGAHQRGWMRMNEKVSGL
jgi:hypothetical protein